VDAPRFFDCRVIQIRKSQHVLACSMKSRTDLCSLFQELAQLTWHSIEKSEAAGTSRGEVGLTEELLPELVLGGGGQVQVTQFSGRQEGKTGADWEWWLTDAGGRRWFGMRIQAKVLSTESHSYKELKYAPGGKLQIERLVETAEDSPNKPYPAYCFYNFWPTSAESPAWPCGSYPETLESWGCAIADAYALLPLVRAGQISLQAVGPHERPWRCLVCCSGYFRALHGSDSILPDLPDIACAFVAGGLRGRLRPDSSPRGDFGGNVIPRVIEGLPRNVMHALELTGRIESERPPPDPHLGGVIVVRGTESNDQAEREKRRT
jgi:hypothetical protein